MFEDIWRNTFGDSKRNEEDGSSELNQEIEELLSSHNLVPTNSYVKKILELYERLEFRKNVIVLGKSFSGKTKALQVSLNSA